MKVLISLALVVLIAAPAFAEEPPPAAPPQEMSTQDARNLFAASFSWCHGMFVMKAGIGGPKLAGTTLEETAVYTTIVKGRGSMPSFKNTLTDDEIKALAKYIKALPNE
ncbi:MAG: c-type cytochrome [bacterium]